MHRTISAILSIVFLSCGNVYEARKSSDQTDCRSVVEARLTTDTVYTVRPPLLLLKRSEYANDTRYLHGNIISINESNVLFSRSEVREPKSYPLDNIECLVDSNNQVVLGKWKSDPEVVWDVELVCQKADSPNGQTVSLVLEQNRTSSYCIGPGDYKIVRIKFSSSDEYLEESDSLHFSRFSVYDNSITYIGTLHTEYKRNLRPGMTAIPTNIIRRRGMAGSGAAAVFGAVGGVVGYLSDQQVLEQAHRSRTLHGLSVLIDPTYTPIFTGSLQLKNSPIILEQAP